MKNMISFQKGFLGILPLLVSGCVGVYDQKFDCEVAPGIACKSISEVNKLVDNNELENAIGEKDDDTASKKASSTKALPSFTDTAIYSAENSSTTLKRQSERTLRIWIASHQNQHGDFFEESYVHTVVTPGKWVEEKTSSRIEEIY